MSTAPLYEHGSERITLSCFEPGARAAAHDHPGGEEILVLKGTFQNADGA